jgi:hypothetical protein
MVPSPGFTAIASTLTLSSALIAAAVALPSKVIALMVRSYLLSDFYLAGI